jgi:hypothetical protein
MTRVIQNKNNNKTSKNDSSLKDNKIKHALEVERSDLEHIKGVKPFY